MDVCRRRPTAAARRRRRFAQGHRRHCRRRHCRRRLRWPSSSPLGTADASAAAARRRRRRFAQGRRCRHYVAATVVVVSAGRRRCRNRRRRRRLRSPPPTPPLRPDARRRRRRQFAQGLRARFDVALGQRAATSCCARRPTLRCHAYAIAATTGPCRRHAAPNLPTAAATPFVGRTNARTNYEP